MGKKSKRGRQQRRAEKRAARRRDNVKRSERTPATPETLAKLERDHLQELEAREPSEGGLGTDAVEALLEIGRAFGVIEAEFGAGNSWLSERADGDGSHEMSDAQARLWSIWNLWATEFYSLTKRTGVEVAGIVQSRAVAGAGTVRLLSLAANLWNKKKRDYDKDKEPSKVRHTIMTGCCE